MPSFLLIELTKTSLIKTANGAFLNVLRLMVLELHAWIHTGSEMIQGRHNWSLPAYSNFKACVMSHNRLIGQ
jgi:hypothetical protein